MDAIVPPSSRRGHPSRIVDVPFAPASVRPLPWHWWLALAALPLWVLAIRALGLWPSVIDWDESLYLIQAREWLNGGWPLVAAWDMHPIGAPAMFAGTMAVLGESIPAIRLLGVACVAATGWGLFFVVRAAGGAAGTGYAAALLYAGHSMTQGGVSVNGELLYAPFTTAAIALAIGRAPTWPRLAGIGLLVGWALLVKPVAAPEGCLAFVLLVGPAWRRGEVSWGRLAGLAAAYAALCAWPTFAFGVVYALRGELHAYLDGSFFAPFRYAQAAAGGGGAAAWRIVAAIGQLLWLFLLAGAAMVLAWRSAPVAIGAAWLLAACVAVAGPAQFFPHYFLIWLPALCLLAACGAAGLAGLLAPARPAATLVLLVGLVALDPWRIDTATRLGQGTAMLRADVPARIAARIAAELPPGATIFIPNYQPVVYVLAGAAIPTRFPFPIHLTGAYARLAGNSTDDEVDRILATRPRFIVVDRDAWGAMRPAAAGAIAAALEAGYELVEVFSDTGNRIELWRLRGA